MRIYGELVEIESSTQVCRDIKDNFLLSLAKDGNADFLLTGDDDLLDIKLFENTRILTYNEFISVLTDSGNINLEDLIAL
jgi:uncharacterized protein